MAGTILITGGCGFIGTNFVSYLIENTDYELVNLDALTYAGNPENLKGLEENTRYSFVKGRIEDPDLVAKILQKKHFKGIINFAAESHVDRSIMDARPFIDTNVSGALVLLDAARKFSVDRFLQVSTDEVYGSLGNEGKFTEETPVSPNSPYSASKAAADHLVMAYVNTYGMDAVVTRCSNNYGPYQFPEKLIPLMIINALENKKLPVYGDGLHVRDWIHVHDHVRGLLDVFEKGESGSVYNIGGNSEMKNIEIVKSILSILGKSESLIEYVKDRPGHDRRYAIDFGRMEQELGWEPEKDFQEGLSETVDWYLKNKDWALRIRSGEYRDYYRKQYGTMD